MRDPNKLHVTKLARRLAVDVYRMTAILPSTERFGLASQMQRAVISVASNIAEGCGRRGDREFARFLYVAHGSATELAIQVDLAVDLGFWGTSDSSALRDEIDHLQRMLNRLTASVHRKLAAALTPSTTKDPTTHE